MKDKSDFLTLGLHIHLNHHRGLRPEIPLLCNFSVTGLAVHPQAVVFWGTGRKHIPQAGCQECP